jgi:hypothetical protein
MHAMRNWLLRLHLYLGLLCSGYLIVFGISSLNFNHPFAFTRPGQEKAAWERSLLLPALRTNDNNAESEAVRDALGLAGWTIPWETYRDNGTGDLHFGVARPGKHYTIHVRRSAGSVHVEERREGYWTVVREMHGNKGVPGSHLMTIWGAYTELCTFVVLFAAASGICLFATRRKDRRAAWLVLGTATVVSLGFMFFIRYAG